MATVERKVIPPEPVKETVTYTLTLTEEEARALRSFLGDQTALQPGASKYPISRTIWLALSSSGAEYDYDETHR